MAKNDGSKNGSNFSGIFVWFLFALSILGLLAGGYVALWGIDTIGIESKNLADLGQFLSGSAVALWTLATVFMLLVAFIMQRNELHGQEEESRKLRSRAYVERIERNFFELVKLHHQIVQRTTVIIRSTRYEGVYCFQELRAQLDSTLRATPALLSNLTYVRNQYKAFFKSQEPALAHYFRQLYHIVLFIHESHLKTVAKKRLTKFLRAQLTSDELFLLFYNGISEYGVKKFNPLIHEYSLLEHLDMSVLPHNSHEDFYEDSATEDTATDVEEDEEP